MTVISKAAIATLLIFITAAANAQVFYLRRQSGYKK